MPEEGKISPIVEMEVGCLVFGKRHLHWGEELFRAPLASGLMENAEIQWEEGNAANHKEPGCF